MGTTTEIGPGTVEARELALIASVLDRSDAAASIVGSDGSPVEVPEELAEVLRTIVDHLKAGNGVSISSIQAELTTAEAAQLLNVSRPHVIKLLDAGEMAHRLVGTHRRIRLVDVLAYRDRQDERSLQALDELTRQAEDLGLYD